MKKLLVCVMIALIPAIASANGLLGYWNFEGNANDVSGYGTAADATLEAGASLTTYNGRNCLEALTGGATVTNNVKWDDIVVAGNDKGGLSSIERGNGITLAAWVRPNDYTAEWKPIMGMTNSGWGARVFSNRSGARGDTQTSNDGWNPVEAWNGDAWNDTDWHFVLYTFDWETDMNYMYLDGTNVWTKQRTADSAWWAASTDMFCIGTEAQNDPSKVYNGYIDDVMIFSGVADAQDVMDLYTGAADAYTVDIVSTPEPATLSILGIGALALIRRRK